jgi:hypothetical protein
MNRATKQPSFVLDERHIAWIRDNWPDLASHFDLFHLEYVRMEQQANARYEVLDDGVPTGRMRPAEYVNPITLADLGLAGRLTEAEKLDQEIQQRMPVVESPITPWLLLAIFAVAVLIAVIQWVAAIVRVAS